MKIYLVCFIDHLRPREVMNELEVIPEEKLPSKVLEMIEEGQICEETIEELGYEEKLNNLSVGEAIEILDCDGYTIQYYGEI